MPTYRYESKNAAGKVSTGVLTAPNLAAASQQLRARGEFILALQPADAAARLAALSTPLVIFPAAFLDS